MEYLCKTCSGVSRKLEPVDALVTEALLRRLEKADFLASLADSDRDAVDAMGEARDLRLTIEGWLRKNMEDDPDPDMEEIRRYKSIWMPRLRDAETRAQAAVPLPHVASIAGKDARVKWAVPEDQGGLTLMERREIIRSMMTITLLSTRRADVYGPTPFDPDSVRIEWRV